MKDVCVALPAVTSILGAAISITIPCYFWKDAPGREREKKQEKDWFHFLLFFSLFLLGKDYFTPILRYVLTEHKTRQCPSDTLIYMRAIIMFEDIFIKKFGALRQKIQ